MESVSYTLKHRETVGTTHVLHTQREYDYLSKVSSPASGSQSWEEGVLDIFQSTTVTLLMEKEVQVQGGKGVAPFLSQAHRAAIGPCPHRCFLPLVSSCIRIGGWPSLGMTSVWTR